MFTEGKGHVGTIERSVRTVKERMRSTCNGIPFKKITILMVRSLVEGIIAVLNAFPSNTGISKTLSPSTIVEGKPKLDFKRKIITFGSYALVYSGTTNTMKGRATPAISLKMSNSAGGHYFMSLYTGKQIHGYKWDELPIDEYVIDRVEFLAEQEKQPMMKNGMPSFEWRPGLEVVDEYDEDREETLAVVNSVNVDVEVGQPPLIIENAAEDILVLPPNNEDPAEQLVVDEDEGMIYLPEDSIVSEEKSIVKSEADINAVDDE